MHFRFDAANADELIGLGDIVVDCCDNFATKFLINDAAMRAGSPGGDRQRVSV